MKLKSIHSITALLAFAFSLPIDAFAHSHWQPESLTRKVARKTKVAAPYIAELKTPSTSAGVVKPRPKLTTVSGPRGDHYGYRR